jgi:hypothetical protein
MASLRPRYEGLHIPAKAGAAIGAGTFVKSKSDAGNTQGQDYVVVHCGAGEHALGVAQNDVTTAQLTQDANSVERDVHVIRRPCIARVVPSHAFSPGDPVASDANGKATLAAAGDHVNGYAVCGCGSSDDFVEVELTDAQIPPTDTDA